MGSGRQVEKLVSVFDLKNCEALRLPEHVSHRIMLIYDKGEKIKEFKMLTRSMPKRDDRPNHLAAQRERRPPSPRISGLAEKEFPPGTKG